MTLIVVKLKCVYTVKWKKSELRLLRRLAGLREA
jgi:hypothetical protein